jgi:hypothetical protein
MKQVENLLKFIGVFSVFVTDAQKTKTAGRVLQGVQKSLERGSPCRAKLLLAGPEVAD